MPFLKWIYRLRGYLIPLPLIFATFCSLYETESIVVWPIGICVLLSGVLLRVWAQQHLHYRLKTHKILTTTGPYQFVRNPIYLGNILLCLGATIISELLWLVPITLLYCFGIYSLVVRYEERHLLSKYGEPYGLFMAEVPRWFPKLRRVKNLGITNEYLKQAMVKEMHCFLLLLPYLLKEIVYSSMI
jgi:protein-S-isoprenylcysteine O-methyltransferase Ste14